MYNLKILDCEFVVDKYWENYVDQININLDSLIVVTKLLGYDIESFKNYHYTTFNFSLDKLTSFAIKVNHQNYYFTSVSFRFIDFSVRSEVSFPTYILNEIDSLLNSLIEEEHVS